MKKKSIKGYAVFDGIKHLVTFPRKTEAEDYRADWFKFDGERELTVIPVLTTPINPKKK